MTTPTLVCAACGHDDRWEGFEDMVRITGQTGSEIEKITVGGCECGHQQKVEIPE